ncbi:PepSY-associated TM helix domain-containing protein [Galbibacter sp.]|uniref:PepSY-associated TM helix domain-containing protein n=1 Tax=Galbibacter sp. TaxID=2918471 RepID=UPI003A928632
MNNRSYNILFHLHTISGIIISAGLFVIFFTGSFSFFRDEIANWQKEEYTQPGDQGIKSNLDPIMDSLSKNYILYGRDIEIGRHYNERRVDINMTASKDSLASEQAKLGSFFYLDTDTFDTYSYLESYTLGEFLYRLHFFAQIPYPYGYYTSGLVSFFFLFAIITGILVHWNKIVSNFYTFRPRAKLKTIWTDAHTALGVIGLPFQFVYAVTGAFFMLNVLMAAPNIMFLFEGSQQKLYNELEMSETPPPLAYEKLDQIPSIEGFAQQARDKWQNINLTHLHIYNYGDRSMRVTVEGELPKNDKYTGTAILSFDAGSGAILAEKDPYKENTYLDGVKNFLYRIHYGDYAGYGLRIISFVLGLISCFVILSGVLIWLVAREKKSVAERKRRFNRALVNIYVSVCLTLYPITALSFIAVKIQGEVDKSFVNDFYFISWLLLSLFFIWRKDNYFTNKYCLLLGSAIGFIVPLVNGIVSGNWFWLSVNEQLFQSFFIDMLWIVLSIVSLWVFFKLKRKDDSTHDQKVQKHSKKPVHARIENAEVVS